jgi:gamma-glutamyl:cysteine ligase YbdK (ATP-grasp superfamily)
MNRQEHVELLKEELDEWNEEIDQLEAKAHKAKAALERVDTIKRKRDEAAHLLSRLQGADGSAWEAARSSAAELWESMKKTVDETKQAFREGLEESR